MFTHVNVEIFFKTSNSKGSPMSALRGSWSTAIIFTTIHPTVVQIFLNRSGGPSLSLSWMNTCCAPDVRWWLCSLTWCFCSTARTDCSVVDYIMLALRVADLVLITVITVLLIRAPGENIHTNICLDWWTQTVSLELKCYSVCQVDSVYKHQKSAGRSIWSTFGAIYIHTHTHTHTYK